MASEGSPSRGCLLIAQSRGLSRFGTSGSKGVPANSCRPTSGFPDWRSFVLKSRALPIELTALSPIMSRLPSGVYTKHQFPLDQPGHDLRARSRSRLRVGSLPIGLALRRYLDWPPQGPPIQIAWAALGRDRDIHPNREGKLVNQAMRVHRSRRTPGWPRRCAAPSTCCEPGECTRRRGVCS
jgi:hypothetical protein